MSYLKLKPEYEKIITDTQKHLNRENEWIDRYFGYINHIDNNKKRISDALSKFKKQQGLNIYLPVTSVNKISKNRVYFDMRCFGHSVATVYVDNSGTVYFNPKDTNVKLFDKYPVPLSGLVNGNTFQWLSKEGTEFRNYFNNLLVAPTQNIEHQFESMLLGNLSQKSSINKHLCGIQPIMLAKQRFQMPTPISACQAKNDQLLYSKHKGGGIDIMARVRHGKGTYLAVIELKDESASQNKSEPPEKALKQAIAYATFIRELLRNKNTNPDKWWELFGFKAGSLPEKLTIKTVIAMPTDAQNSICFAGEKLVFPNSEDNLELHYLYFDMTNPSKTVTSL